MLALPLIADEYSWIAVFTLLLALWVTTMTLEDLFLKTIQENPRDGDQESYRQEWGRKVAQVVPGSESKKESTEES